MSIVRVGTTQKYSENWDSIFKGRKSSAAKPAAKPAASTKKAATKAKTTAKAKPAKSAAGKKKKK